MPLDSNLFVLSIQPRPDVAQWLDLKEEGKEDNRYSAYKDTDDKLHLIDPWTDATYASLNMLEPNKLAAVEFVEPEAKVELKNTGNLSWRWTFEWENNRYDWSRASSSLLGGERAYTLSISRKPDPDFPVAIFTPAQKRKPNLVQLLDYNISRIEPKIEDQKGFEVMTLLSLLCFVDYLFAGASPVPSSSLGAKVVPAQISNAPPGAPPPLAPLIKHEEPSKNMKPSPTPPQRTTSNALSANELEISDTALKEEYLKQSLTLLKDESMLWVLLIGATADIVPHVISLAETVKRKHYKQTGEELKQFVDDSGAGSSSDGARFSTPSKIKVYLSRIDMTEMLPNYRSKSSSGKPRHTVRQPIVLDGTDGKKDKAKDDSPASGGGGLFGWGRRS